MKTKTQHTPGPWTVQVQGYKNSLGRLKNWFVICGPSGLIGNYAPSLLPIAEAKTATNARLIAASPDLLTAAKSALISLEMARDINGDKLDANAGVLVELRAAIAKAEGK